MSHQKKKEKTERKLLMRLCIWKITTKSYLIILPKCFVSKIKRLCSKLHHRTGIVQGISEFFKPALPVAVVRILPWGNKHSWLSYIACRDASHWEINKKLHMALPSSYNFLIEICNVSEESLVCELNFTEETLTLPNVSTKSSRSESTTEASI